MAAASQTTASSTTVGAVASRRCAAGLTAAAVAVAGTSSGAAFQFAPASGVGSSSGAGAQIQGPGVSLRASLAGETRVEGVQQPTTNKGANNSVPASFAVGAAAVAAAGVAGVRRRGRSEKVPSIQRRATSPSKAVPFLSVPRGLTNDPNNTSYPGDFGFDPLGFASDRSPLNEVDEYMNEVAKNFGLEGFSKLRWYREAELMHGRVCMLAVFNIIIRETGNIFDIVPDETLETSAEAVLQFASVMVVLEAYRGSRLLVDTNRLAGDLGLGMGPGDALAKEMTLEELAVKQVRELQNSRLAMVAFVGMVVAYLQTGHYVLQQDQVVKLQETLEKVAFQDLASLEEFFSPFLTVLFGVLVVDGARRLAATDETVAKKMAGNSIAKKALNPLALNFGVQDPGVPLPDGVAAGQLPQHLNITPEQIVEFEEDGVIMIKGAMKNWVPFLRACTDHQIGNPHVWSLVGRMSGLYDYIQRNMWMTNNGFRDFLYYSPLGSALSQLGRTPEVRVSTDMLLVNPNKGFGWHQDNQNGPIDFPDAMRWWVAMDKCGENDYGAPEYICGSHRNQTVSKEAVFVERDAGDLGTYQRTKKFVAEPGDLIIWDAKCIHRIVAPPGQFWEEGTQRRAFGGTVAKTGAIYLNKGGASAISDLSGHTQQSGELLGGPYFPQIYPNRVPEEEDIRNRGQIEGRSTKKIVDLGVTLASNAGKYISFTKVVGKKN